MQKTSFNEENMTAIRQAYEGFKQTYGEDAIYPFLEWIKQKQIEFRYAIKESVVFLKLELDLAHLLSEREIIAFHIRQTGGTLEQSPYYKSKNEEIDIFVREYTKMPGRILL